MRVVFVADDLGYCPVRDAGIFLAATRGVVSAASLLVQGASAATAARHGAYVTFGDKTNGRGS